jgi:hypothetical protein
MVAALEGGVIVPGVRLILTLSAQINLLPFCHPVSRSEALLTKE